MAPQPEIIEAIKKVRATVTPIKHDAENPHGEYTYVSIDTYYVKIAKVATEVGLIWRTKELSFDFLEGQGRAKDRTYVKAKFQYDLYLGSSSMEDYMQITILSPIDGPQTTGQLYSYADKVFMRVAFCVPTGEKDADATQQEAILVKTKGPDPILDKPVHMEDLVPSRQMALADIPHNKETGEIIDVPVLGTTDLAPKFKDDVPLIDTRKVNAEAAGTILKIFETFMPTVKTRAKLTDWHAENLAAIEKVKQVDPTVGDKIKLLFNNRFKELQPKERK